MIDDRVVAVVREVAREEGTPEEIVAPVLARMLPAIRLVPQTSDDLPLGGCRIGGGPDLSRGSKWPRLGGSPWQFILQVNLAEVAAFDVTGALPREGLLSFFFLWDPHGGTGDRAHIVFTPSLDRLQRKRFPGNLPDEERYRPLKLVPRLEWTVPSIEDAGLPLDILDPNEPVYLQDFGYYRFFEHVNARVAEAHGFEPDLSTNTVAHQLLGHPKLIQSPGLADGTRLLLQADSDPHPHLTPNHPMTGMAWGDSGRLYYLIDEDDLKAHRLADKPWVTVEMC